MYLKFLIFKLSNVSNKDNSSIPKRLRSAMNKHNKKLQHVSKELSLSKNFLSKQYLGFYILNKLTTSHNKKSLQKLSSLTPATEESNEDLIEMEKL